MKKNMFLAVSLMFSVVTTALPLYEQERDMVYTIHALDQDLAIIPGISQNIDMFIGMFKMNSQVLEKKLAIANKKLRNTWLKNAVITGAITASRAVGMNYLNTQYRSYITLVSSFVYISGAIGGFQGAWSAIDSYDVYKERNALRAALALDEEILEKLEEIKSTMIFNVQPSETTNQEAEEKNTVDLTSALTI